jgi:hypothetical protein
VCGVAGGRRAAWCGAAGGRRAALCGAVRGGGRAAWCGAAGGRGGPTRGMAEGTSGDPFPPITPDSAGARRQRSGNRPLTAEHRWATRRSAGKGRGAAAARGRPGAGRGPPGAPRPRRARAPAPLKRRDAGNPYSPIVPPAPSARQVGGVFRHLSATRVGTPWRVANRWRRRRPARPPPARSTTAAAPRRAPRAARAAAANPRRLVVGPQAIPAVELEALVGERGAAVVR